MKIEQKFECASMSKLGILERETRRMKKALAKKEYIKMRISMLKIERDNPRNSEYDAHWYNRLIQELEWAENMLLSENYPKPSNCFMENEVNG